MSVSASKADQPSEVSTHPAVCLADKSLHAVLMLPLQLAAGLLASCRSSFKVLCNFCEAHVCLCMGPAVILQGRAALLGQPNSVGECCVQLQNVSMHPRVCIRSACNVISHLLVVGSVFLYACKGRLLFVCEVNWGRDLTNCSSVNLGVASFPGCTYHDAAAVEESTFPSSPFCSDVERRAKFP